MSLSKPRNRSVVFRLTEEEYAALRDACQRSGGRSLSEFARNSLLGSIAIRPRGPKKDPTITRLEAKLTETNSALQSLIILVTRILTPASK
jgi:hypothetical protein